MDEKKPLDAGDESEVKGFNESELEDIMNEIENLEKEFSDGPAPAPAEKAPAPEVHADSAPANVVEMRAPAAPPTPAPAPIMAPARPLASAVTPSSMELSIAGEMAVQLNFRIGDQTVQLSVSEKDGLVIEMDGGAKFCVPLPLKKVS